MIVVCVSLVIAFAFYSSDETSGELNIESTSWLAALLTFSFNQPGHIKRVSLLSIIYLFIYLWEISLYNNNYVTLCGFVIKNLKFILLHG